MRSPLTLTVLATTALLAACSGEGASALGGGAPTPSASGTASPRPAAPGSGGGSAPPLGPTATPAPDGGLGGPDGVDSGAPPASGTVPGLVAVGYGGLRLRSTDAGKTWTGTAAASGGGDDYELLRAVAYASGRWLAVGWKATTSVDGVTWTTPARINEPGGVSWTGAPDCGLVEGLTSDGTYFYATCASYGGADKALRSTDGVTWTALGTIGNLGGHPALAYRGGVFYAYGDGGTSYRSSDGVTWAAAAGLPQATYCEGQWKTLTACHDASWFGGFYFQGVWQSKLARSSNGASFAVVHDDPSNNTIYQPRAIAEGFVRP